MKDLKVFFKSIPVFIWVIFFVLILIICCLPSILIRPGRISFAETGQIGDTIGGIMGPFIAIVAAILTFIAFWVQFEANNNQRKDIAIERIENKYYTMLDIYSQFTNNLDVHGIKGKAAFAELVGELSFTYHLIENVYKRLSQSKEYLSSSPENVKNLITEFNHNPEIKYNYLTILAYNLFFYGHFYMLVDVAHGERTRLAEDIKNEALSINNQAQGSYEFLTYVKSNKQEYADTNYRLKHKLLKGHSDFLGHYFRHLFQTVKYIASIDDDLVPETKKYEYIKMLRAQMSDYEQILLYYNSLTSQGAAWNSVTNEDFPQCEGYIGRFRLIKNLPPNFPLFGITPDYKYKKTIEKWHENNKSFFEQEHLAISLHALLSRE